jgi:hypothetical protein
MKNPKGKTHVQYLLDRLLPEEYEPQVNFELACTERDWCDFISFDSRMPRRFQLHMERVYRNEKRIAEINAAAEQFLREVDDVIAELEQLYPEIPEVGSSPLKTKLRQSVQEIDPSLGISDMDLPAWAKAMGHKL